MSAKKTHKTEAVMKLLTGSSPAVNPILDNEFKQAVIESRNVPETPAKKVEEPKPEELAAEPTSAPVREEPASIPEVSVSSELVSELLPAALERFHCCTCGKCFAEAMSDALDAVPSIKVKIHNGDDLKRADEIKQQTRNEVMKAIVKIAISRRGKEIHQ